MKRAGLSPFLYGLLACVSVDGWAQSGETSAPASAATAPAAYEDRLIEDGNLKPEFTTSGAGESTSSGWPRSYNVSAQAGSTSQNAVRSTTTSLTASAQIETPNYGILAADLSIRTNPNSAFGVIENRRLPIAGGWFASHAAGVVNLQMPSAPRNGSRFSLPGAAMFGISSRWENNARGIDLAASTGRPGKFDADTSFAGFTRGGGQYSTAGGAYTQGPWQAGATFFSASNENDDTLQLKRADSLHVSSAWRREDTSVLAQLVNGTAPGGNRANGVWVEGSLRSGAFLHEAGAYRFDPGLHWGTFAIAADIQGVHYRTGYRTRRFIWDAGLEAFSSISGTQPPGRFFTLNGRYQWSRDFGAGASLAVRQQNGNAYSTATYADTTNTWGNLRLQGDLSESQIKEKTRRVLVDQAFTDLPATLRLNMSLGLESVSSTAVSEQAALVSALVGYEARPGLGLDAGMRVRRSFSSTGSTANELSLSARWQLNPYWLVAASMSAGRSTFTQNINLDPLAPPVISSASTSSSNFLITLRYQEQAGRSSTPLGGRAGEGSGSIRGVLYLDENGNGRREAGEVAAANVVVMLDGRYSARTNGQGLFEFPFVGAGEHTLTVVADNLPLPWYAPEEPTKFVVTPRNATVLDIGAKK